MNFSDQMLEMDWQSTFVHARTLALWDDPQDETAFHTYYLWVDRSAGRTYVMDVDPEHFTEESCLPFASFGGNLLEQLEALQQEQRQRADQPEQNSGFSPEGLLFSSSGGSFDQVAQDFGAALAQAYLGLSVDDPGAVAFAQVSSWSITQTIPDDSDRFCARLSMVVQPLAPNTVYWMSGGGLELTEDGRWLDTHEYRLERVEGDTWICAEYGGSVSLPGEEITIQNAGEQISDSETWTDGLSFSGLAPGAETVRSEAVQIPEGGADFIYTITYSRPSLTLEAGLRRIDGTEYHQRVEDGDAHGTLEDIPAGIYTLFVRNVGDYTHFSSYQDDSGHYNATGAINFYLGTETDQPTE